MLARLSRVKPAALAAALGCLLPASPARSQQPAPAGATADPYEDPPIEPSGIATDAGAATQDCLDSFKRAQRYRKHSELINARAELLVCGQPSCQHAIVAKCVEWMEEVRAAIPTIIVGAVDHRGLDIKGASLRIDGKLVTSSLDGIPIDVDPGPHALRVTFDGRSQIEEIVAMQGARNRVVRIRFDPPRAPPPPASAASRVHVMSWIGFGIGAVGLVVGGITGAVALVKGRELQNACPGGICYQYQKDDFYSGRALAHTSTVSFAVAGAGVVIGVAGLIAFRPKQQKRSGVEVTPLGLPQDTRTWAAPAGVALIGRF